MEAIRIESYFQKLILQRIKIILQRKKVLVTGGAGAIGTNLVFMLSELVGQKV